MSAGRSGVEQVFEVEAKPGEVAHIAQPWAYVKLDGRALGQTPIGRHELYEGAHLLELSNTELNVTRRLELKLKGGETKVVSVNLEE